MGINKNLKNRGKETMKFQSNCTPMIICHILYYKAVACSDPPQNQYLGEKITRGNESREIIFSLNPYGILELTTDGNLLYLII